MSVFSTAALAARQIHYTTFGEKVTYSRNGETPITNLDIILSAEDSDFEQVGEVFIPQKQLIGTIKKADLDFGSGPVVPARGDKITTAEGKVFDAEGDNPAEEKRDTDEWKIALGKSGSG